MALDLSKLSEDDLKSRERFQEIVGKFENALFTTFKAADSRTSSSRDTWRGESKTAWKELADDVIEFALEED